MGSVKSPTAFESLPSIRLPCINIQVQILWGIRRKGCGISPSLITQTSLLDINAVFKDSRCRLGVGRPASSGSLRVLRVSRAPPFGCTISGPGGGVNIIVLASPSQTSLVINVIVTVVLQASMGNYPDVIKFIPTSAPLKNHFCKKHFSPSPRAKIAIKGTHA